MSNDSSNEVVPTAITPSSQVPWNPWVGAFVAIFIFISAQFAAFIVLIFGALPLQMIFDLSEEELNNSFILQILFYVLAAAIILGGIRIFLNISKADFKSLGLRRPKWSDPLYSLAALPIYLILFVIIVSIVKFLVPGLDINQAQDLGFNDDYGPIQLIFIALALVVLPPLMEEVTFRGLLYGSLRKGIPVIIAAIITSLFFAAGHLLQSSDGKLLFIAGIDTFTLSLVLVYLREKSGGLWAPIGLHAIKNGIAFVALFIVGTS